MTSQQEADEALALYQSLRELPPEERIEVMMARFFDPPLVSDLEYEITLRALENALND